MRYDVNDGYQREKMLRHCPQRLWGDERLMRLYLKAVEDYARYNTLLVQSNEAGPDTPRHNGLHSLGNYYHWEAWGIALSLEVMTGNEDHLASNLPVGEVWQGITEDGHELYVEQWQWGTFNGGV